MKGENMINKNLNLCDSIDLLNQMLKHTEDYDWDSDGVVYIAVNFKKCENILKMLLPNKDNFKSYLKDFLEDDTVDITGIWGDICFTFNTDIWVNLKKNKFYVCRWYHRVSRAFSDFRRDVKYKYKSAKDKWKFKMYDYKRERAIKKRIKEICRNK